MNDYKYVKNSREKRKRQMVYVMGEKCQLCGYNHSVFALEFHHINPKEKSFSFNKADNMNWLKIEEELKKCILLCANCHREIHYEESKVILQSSFDETKAKEIAQEIGNLKQRKQYYCENCGKLVSFGNNLCSDCAAQKRRVVDRPSREELKKMIREESFLSLGKKFGVTDNAIRKWCLKYNLPSKKTEIKKYSEEEWSKI